MRFPGEFFRSCGVSAWWSDRTADRRRQERTLMRIGIIGSGHIGGTLTRRLTALGHEVTVANSRGPESLRDLATETGAAAGTVEQAAAADDLVVLAVPLAAVPALPGDAFSGRVVVDANNYYPQRDGEIPELADRSLTSSRWTADRLPGARVVKTFNTIQAQHLLENGRPAGEAERIALPVAADDADAKQLVMNVVESLGFDPVDAGTLDESWRQQPDTAVYGTDRDADGVRRGLAEARP
ncbi:NAD(P)-binding domain-containing protein [Micromonospora sp. WMMD882]|uniref:NADPH-dependent F420 reductase n=1 Tax=Micromonospora sp. WMMD882 TaxID=3015151 RepID=UPI00248C57D8|nr:NAD(P)-binding domain-containing protein [Micromonospora sp. WMMD882]WBB78768.1 NAD(P)-binding domain-containing protein [Micromonospora sp. WMMD882]